MGEAASQESRRPEADRRHEGQDPSAPDEGGRTRGQEKRAGLRTSILPTSDVHCTTATKLFFKLSFVLCIFQFVKKDEKRLFCSKSKSSDDGCGSVDTCVFPFVVL